MTTSRIKHILLNNQRKHLFELYTIRIANQFFARFHKYRFNFGDDKFSDQSQRFKENEASLPLH